MIVRTPAMQAPGPFAMPASPFPRREFLYGLGASLGSVAFTSLLAAEEKKNPLAPKDRTSPGEGEERASS